MLTMAKVACRRLHACFARLVSLLDASSWIAACWIVI